MWSDTASYFYKWIYSGRSWQLWQGKPANQDEKAGKATFVSTMGKEQAKARAEMLVHQAIRHLHIFDGRAEMLKELAMYVLERRA